MDPWFNISEQRSNVSSFTMPLSLHIILQTIDSSCMNSFTSAYQELNTTSIKTLWRTLWKGHSLHGNFVGFFCTLCVTIFNARVPFFRFSDLRNTLLITCMLLCSSFLAPVFWQLWIYAGSANANFFFAITLAYSTAQVTSVLMARWVLMVRYFTFYSCWKY